jgi:hypothetical protein
MYFYLTSALIPRPYHPQEIGPVAHFYKSLVWSHGQSRTGTENLAPIEPRA